MLKSNPKLDTCFEINFLCSGRRFDGFEGEFLKNLGISPALSDSLLSYFCLLIKANTIRIPSIADALALSSNELLEKYATWNKSGTGGGAARGLHGVTALEGPLLAKI